MEEVESLASAVKRKQLELAADRKWLETYIERLGEDKRNTSAIARRDELVDAKQRCQSMNIHFDSANVFGQTYIGELCNSFQNPISRDCQCQRKSFDDLGEGLKKMSDTRAYDFLRRSVIEKIATRSIIDIHHGFVARYHAENFMLEYKHEELPRVEHEAPHVKHASSFALYFHKKVEWPDTDVVDSHNLPGIGQQIFNSKSIIVLQ